MHNTTALELSHLNGMQPSLMLGSAPVCIPALTSRAVCCEEGPIET